MLNNLANTAAEGCSTHRRFPGRWRASTRRHLTSQLQVVCIATRVSNELTNTQDDLKLETMAANEAFRRCARRLESFGPAMKSTAWQTMIRLRRRYTIETPIVIGHRFRFYRQLRTEDPTIFFISCQSSCRCNFLPMICRAPRKRGCQLT